MADAAPTTTPPAVDVESDVDVFDFDAWYAEHVDATIPFKILGRTWDVPGDVDAAVLLRLQRLEHAILTGQFAAIAGDLHELTFDQMTRSMVGDAILDAWLEAGMKQQMLQAVTRRLYAIYKGEDPDQAMGIEPPNTEG